MSKQVVPSWPSLYNPGLEILHIQHHSPTQLGGFYLYHASDIFRFTLYWTLIFYIPPFLICGFYAFWNYSFPPSPRTFGVSNGLGPEHTLSDFSPAPPHSKSTTPVVQPTKTQKANERRSRVAFALLVLLTFLSLSLAGAVIGSAILGFVIFGVYKSANFNMSTWIPFLLAIMQVLIGVLSIWPSIIEII